MLQADFRGKVFVSIFYQLPELHFGTSYKIRQNAHMWWFACVPFRMLLSSHETSFFVSCRQRAVIDSDTIIIVSMMCLRCCYWGLYGIVIAVVMSHSEYLTWV